MSASRTDSSRGEDGLRRGERTLAFREGKPQPVRIDQGQDVLPKTNFGRIDLDPVTSESPAPKAEAARRHRERDFRAQAMSLPVRRQLRPREKSQVGPWVTLGVGVEEMISAGIILVDASLHQPHPEHAGVEIEILLRGSGDGGDVMKPSDRLQCHTFAQLAHQQNALSSL